MKSLRKAEKQTRRISDYSKAQNTNALDFHLQLHLQNSIQSASLISMHLICSSVYIKTIGDKGYLAALLPGSRHAMLLLSKRKYPEMKGITF